MSNVNIKIFPNGLTLAHSYQDIDIVSLLIGVKIGSTNDGDKLGISHLLEHMMFKGTTTRNSYELSLILEKLGAGTNAFTGYASTAYYAYGRACFADTLSDILSDQFFNSTFDKKELAKEKRVVIEEINESLDNPSDVTIHALDTVIFKGTPYENDIVGTKQSVRNISSEDLINYRNRCYTSNNAIVVIVGGVSFEDAISLCEKHFVSKFGLEKYEQTNQIIKMQSGFITKNKDLNQNFIEIALPGVDCNNDLLFPLRGAISIFGNSSKFTSRLYQALRERHPVCYSCYATVLSNKSVGTTNISLSLNPKETEEAINIIKKEAQLFLDKGITDEELEIYKNGYYTQQILADQQIRQRMTTIFSFIANGQDPDFDLIAKKVLATTKDDIMDAAKYAFDFDKVAAALVGKNAKKVNLEKYFKV